jgi:predicted transcriptional regulator of viral defense system
LDWVTTLATEARTSPVLRIRELASKYRLSTSAVARALARQKKRSILEQLTSDTYLNRLAPAVTTRDVLNTLVPDSYISLGTALAEWGLSTQNPLATTAVSLSHTKNIKTTSIEIRYRKIHRDLFWGFTEKKARYATYKIAEPEKALLDWIYFHLKDGLPVEFDEIQFDRLSRSKLVAYAKKFPNTVIQTLFFPMLEGQIANLQP